MTIAFFTPAGYASLNATSTSQNTLIPGSPACALITNFGPNPVAVLVGTGSTLSVSASTGLIIPAGQTQAIAAVGGSYLAYLAVGASPGGSGVSVAYGA